MRQFLLLLTGLVLTAPASWAEPLEDQTWHEVTSDNFTVYSTLGAAQATELVHTLELLRAAFPVITNIGTTESSIPTHIVSVKSTAELRRLGIPPPAVGVFIEGLRKNTILMRASRFLEGTGVIAHEYVHFLTNNNSEQEYPRWFSEGFAEYFSAVALNDGNFEIGRMPKERLTSFRSCDWVNVKYLIDPQLPRDYTAGRYAGCMFYPESWAIVHFIQRMPNRSGMLADYLARVEQGAAHYDAFTEAFDVDMTDFNRKVREYVKKGEFSYISVPADELLPDFSVEQRTLAREEAALLLGQTALFRGKPKHVRHWLDIAAQAQSTRAQAEAAIGDLYKVEDDYAAAEQHFERALALGADDPLIQLDVGEYWMYRARQVKDTDEKERDRLLRIARKYFGAAWKINDQLPETYAMYGSTFLLQQDYEKALDTLEAANRLLPSSESVRIDLARTYHGLGRNDDALAHARLLKAWSHEGSSIGKAAAQLIEDIKDPQATAAD